mmetsp:Transcript_11459/g.14186  ORF Transcript_11459/g.14186 Transcript_11459/m.14186 type:complete len:685 (-) Transcript_11459:209-2263(-)|eukprot:CAMPEP_0172506572 /NCGR_PEP_ID=MMETSP1066-20121228/196305_1 /TAXON_ID=671091 /ORGANISM="Coscinodiscus wailesii, Strain CCMP2513" /LENGTH=684 /DNA_ID=CAMNT_0013283657 /DNA_START=41 /DNA_END=2095 /DNA_ORIENTATION=+
MVKFGRHLQTYLEEQPNKEGERPPYIVPYNDIKGLVDDTSLFTDKWYESLELVSADFHKSMSELWQRIFDYISPMPESRGATPDLALQLYVGTIERSRSLELLAIVRKIHAMSLMNAEALRKLAKKYDKAKQKKAAAGAAGNDATQDGGHPQKLLGCKLLPQLYASNFVTGQNLLETGLELLRIHLEMDGADDLHEDEKKESMAHESDTMTLYEDKEDEEEEAPTRSFFPLFKSKRETSVESKRNEFAWLRNLVTNHLTNGQIQHLVAHRGFHCNNDRVDGRPLENSLSAYESAWTSGVTLCECDIALTQDEKLILAHDENFTRLALDPTSPYSTRKVQELSFKDIMSLPLKTGTRPPLLIDVLRSAQAIGDHAQLIIEIKPGNSEAATALVAMLTRHPKLMKHCAVIMSFDLFTMHNVRKEFGVWAAETAAFDAPPNTKLSRTSIGKLSTLGSLGSLPTSMSIGNGLHHQKLTSQTRLSLHNMASIASAAPHDNTTATGSTNTNTSRLNGTQTEIGYAYDSADHFGVGLVSMSDLRNPSLSHASFATPAAAPPHAAAAASIIPKLLLLTTAQAPDHPCELRLTIASDDPQLIKSSVHSWLHASDGGQLDGIYMQYENFMLNPTGAAILRELSDLYMLGIWGDAKTPDNYETFSSLLECGCNFVNSDLPRGFMRRASLTESRSM